ncbi:MAG TPA: preprotein translocase subunit SecG [Armatimonadota bacterium]|jgi:preprotein translocase subunit SecG
MLTFVHILQVLVCIALITLVMSHSSKDSGLGAMGGGAQPSNTRFKPGFEERLDNMTRGVAVAFMVLSFLAAYLNK